MKADVPGKKKDISHLRMYGHISAASVHEILC